MTAVAPDTQAPPADVAGGDVVLIAHGSPDPRHASSVERLAGRLRRLMGVTVTAAYLEHNDPRVSTLLGTPGPVSVDVTVRRTVVVPLLLTAGFHWHSDIPPVLVHGGSRSTLLAPPEPLGFAATIAALTDGHDHVVLASAGSARPEVVGRFGALASALTTGSTRVEVALTPSAVTDAGNSGSAVVPVLTADGIFADRIRRAATNAGATTTPVLGDTEGFARTIANLVQESL